MSNAAGKLLQGEEFTDLANGVQKQTMSLCAETYKATKKPPGLRELEALVDRAEKFLAEVNRLCSLYGGGRREALRSAALDTEELAEFTTQLRALIEERKSKGSGS